MSAAKSMRDALYEEPGPKTRRKMLVGTALSLAALAALVAWVVYRFWVTGQLAPKYWELFSWRTTWRYLFAGLEGTFAVALTAAVLSIVLGMLLMLGRTSHLRVLSVVCAVLTNVLRGIPSLLFIYFFFFAMPNLGIKMPAFWMLCIPVTLAASGVLAEVFRAGVNAVPRGQTEAGLSIGLSRWKVKTKIVLPQAVRLVIPSLISQLVVVVKDTALAYVVSYPDLMQNAQVLRTNYDALVSTFLVVALIYIVINYLINKVAVYVSRRTGVKIIR
uniref:amino acid ABC transporter permease n=1 Tax=Parolsenella massiliensis TaxID=1871022 RepID=UPI0009322869|nr:amino acid ABC transporter permease [Parolsenella massiliensis]